MPTDPDTGLYYADPMVAEDDPFRTGLPALTPPSPLSLPDVSEPLIAEDDPFRTGAPSLVPPSVSVGGGVSRSGFSAPDAAGRLAFGRQATKGLGKADQADLQALGDSQFAASAENERLALEGQERIGQAQKAVSQATSEGYQSISDEVTRQVADAERREAEHLQDIEDSKGRWMEQVAKGQAMGLDPDRLMKRAGGTGRLGFAAAAFAENFLGAKGIKVSAIDNIKSRISDDINAQLSDIQNQRETTSQFRALYEAARADAMDERGVRDRLNGMYLVAAENAIKAKIGSAQSELEVANNFKLLQDIRRARIASDAQIHSGIIEEANKRRQFREKMAIEWAQRADARAALDWEMSADNPKNQAKPGKERAASSRALIATDADGTNRVIGVLREGYTPEQQFKIQSDINGATKMSRDLSKIVEDLDAEAPGLFASSGTISSALASPKSQEYKARARRVVREYIKTISGAQVTDREADDYLNSILPIAADWKRTPVKKIMRNFQEDVLENASRGVAGFTEEVAPEVLQSIPRGQANDLGGPDILKAKAEDRPLTTTSGEAVKAAILSPDTNPRFYNVPSGSPGASAVATALRRADRLNLNEKTALDNLAREANTNLDVRTALIDLSTDKQFPAAVRAYATELLSTLHTVEGKPRTSIESPLGGADIQVIHSDPYLQR